MSVEVYPASAWVIAQLRTVTQNLHERPAPAALKTPYLTWSIEPESYQSVVGGHISEARYDVSVIAVAANDPAFARNLVEGARNVLHRRSGERDGYHVSAREIGSVRLPVYRFNDTPFFDVGARYRVKASKRPEPAVA